MTSLPESSPGESFAKLLERCGAGDREALGRLTTLLYPELRRIAASQMRKERQNHTLQPTALVNEAFLRLAGHPQVDMHSKAHFLALAAGLIRRVLVDHARAHIAEKRGGALRRITLNEPLAASEPPTVDLLAVDELLKQLAELDRRQAQVVELHIFADMPFEEIALVLGLSARTVKRDWSMARAWLHSRLGERR